MASLIIVAVFSGYMRFYHVRRLAAPLALMVFYFAAVGATQYVITTDDRTIISPIYYLYNSLLLVLAASIAHQNPRELRSIGRLAILAMLTIECVNVYAFSPATVTRAIGTFNDPNQLGYMTVLSVFCYLILKNEKRLTLQDLSVLLLAALIILETKSRSASLGWIAMTGATYLSLKSTIALKVSLFLLAISVAVLLVFFGADVLQHSGIEHKLDGLLVRFEENGADDSIAGRGYDRLWLYPEYLGLGAGEGAWDRFGGVHEIHSTWANILFSYGIIGFALFITVLARIFRSAPTHYLLLFAGPVAFGMTTYGARFSLFWIGLGLVFGLHSRATRSHGFTTGNLSRLARSDRMNSF